MLVDRSYSMGYADHWKRALDAARANTSDLAGNDRATIVFFANDPVAATDPTADRARLERAIAGAKLSSEGTRYEPALKLAAQILSASNLPRKEVVMISDFQRVAWGAAGRHPVFRRAPQMTTVDVGGKRQHRDLAVTQVSTDRDRVGDRDRVTVTARVTNLGAAARTVDATLDLGGRAVETKKLTVPSKGVAQARFAPNAVPATATRGTVRITHDSLPQNDSFNFTLAPGEALSVLVVQPAKPRTNQSLYVSRALAIGDRPAFHVDVKSEDALARARSRVALARDSRRGSAAERSGWRASARVDSRGNRPAGGARRSRLRSLAAMNGARSCPRDSARSWTARAMPAAPSRRWTTAIRCSSCSRRLAAATSPPRTCSGTGSSSRPATAA